MIWEQSDIEKMKFYGNSYVGSHVVDRIEGLMHNTNNQHM